VAAVSVVVMLVMMMTMSMMMAMFLGRVPLVFFRLVPNIIARDGASHRPKEAVVFLVSHKITCRSPG